MRNNKSGNTPGKPAMMRQSYTDIHFHHSFDGKPINVKSLLRAMDKARIAKIALISDYGNNLREQRRNIAALAPALAACPERIYGLAWIEPRHKTPLGDLEKIIGKYKYRGFKLIPNQWYPCDEWLFSYYDKMAELNAPCLFHSGILYFKTYSSKYCRPVYYEDLIKVRNFRFALAHIGWPWQEECLAVWGQWRAARREQHAAWSDQGVTSEMFLDIASSHRRPFLKRLLDFGAGEALLFGSDTLLPGDGHFDALVESWQTRIKEDTKIFRELAVSKETQDKIFQGNFERFFEGAKAANPAAKS